MRDFIQLKQSIKEVLYWLTLPATIPIALMRGRFKRNNICMFHCGRSGSTVLADLFGNHKFIHWDGEIYPRLFHTRDKTGIERKNYPDGKAFSHLKIRMCGVINKYYGFETKKIHLEWLSVTENQFIERLIKIGFDQFILLERRNHLRTILSYTIGKSSGKWHVHTEDPVHLVPVKLNFDKVYFEYEEMDLLSALEKTESYFDRLKAALQQIQVPFINLYYEDHILENPYGAYKIVVEKLHLKQESSRVRFTRTNPYPIENMVANYSDLCKKLASTKYAWMLTD